MVRRASDHPLSWSSSRPRLNASRRYSAWYQTWYQCSYSCGLLDLPVRLGPVHTVSAQVWNMTGRTFKLTGVLPSGHWSKEATRWWIWSLYDQLTEKVRQNKPALWQGLSGRDCNIKPSQCKENIQDKTFNLNKRREKLPLKYEILFKTLAIVSNELCTSVLPQGDS